ncbi:AbiV family abortive infection protein [Lichenihabitans sp. Uapishka_5]|nr:AbiV family abortive infection protein [Lichenihabitans sp. Uapishka_5]
MKKLAKRSMKDLNLIRICQGIVAVKDNALELLDDAKILRANNKLARAYAAAYMACEENGKLSILLGAATQPLLGALLIGNRRPSGLDLMIPRPASLWA